MPGPLQGRRPVARFRLACLLAVALPSLGLPSLAGAQAIPPGPEPGERRPIDLLLEQRESLALTSAQLGRLEAIRDRLARANEPLVNRMMTLRREWQQQRVAGRRAAPPENATRLERIRSAAEPIRARIQENNRTAMQAVNRVLTPGQRARVRAMVEERRRLEGAAPPAGRGSNAGARD